MAVDVGSAVGYLDLDISGFLAGLRTAQTEADSATKNIATKIGGNLSNIGKSLSSAGTTLTKNVTVPLLGIGAAGLKVATDFEKGMSEVKAISGATGEEFDALKDKAIDLGATTAFSAGEVAEAMTEMAKAGWSSQQIIDGMGGVLDAAAASGEGLATVSTIVADAITGFGLAAADSTMVADLLTQAANSGTIGITDLGESFKYIAPVAGAMGISIQDATTAIAAMSMAGIKGSQAGTSLRTMLTNLVKPTAAMATAMDTLGIEILNADGSMKSLDDIIANLRDSFSGLTEAERAQYAAILAGKEGMSGLLSILNLTEEEYNAIAESMDNANGIAQETAAIMQDNLQSKVEQLFGALESLAIKLADFVIPYLQQFVVWLTNLVEKFTALDPETQKTILKFAGLAAAAGPVLLIIGKLVSAVGGLFTVFGKIPAAIVAVKTGFVGAVAAIKRVGEAITLAKAGFTGFAAQASPLGAALAGITVPMLAIAAAIGVVIAAFISLWKNNEEFRDKITAIWNQVKETFNGFAQGIVERINALGFDFENIAEVIKAVWQGLCDFLAPIFTGAFQLIADTFQAVTDIILGILDIFIGVFTGNWTQVWEGIKLIFQSAWDWLINTLSNLGNTLLGVFDTICGWFGTTWSSTWESIKTFFTNTWNNITSFLSTAWNTISNIITTVINAIKTVISNVFNTIKTIITNVINGVKNTISTGLSSAKNTVFTIFNAIKDKIHSTMENAKTTVKEGIEKLKSFFNFTWSLPKIKLPHFSISGKFSLDPPSVPTFSVSWYKKAMFGGMILDAPTIFGYDAKSGQFLGAGEAGSETIVGTSSLMKMIRQSVADSIKPFIDVTRHLAKASEELGYTTYNGFAKQAKTLERVLVSGRVNSRGDTFIFNSPKAIDEIEAAKQMKKAKRELAEGF